MSAYCYQITQEQHSAYISYGICALCSIAPNDWQVAARIADISCDRQFAEQLAEKYTRFQLSPLHLCEAVPDELN